MSALTDTDRLEVTPKYWIQFNSIQNDSEPPWHEKIERMSF